MLNYYMNGNDAFRLMLYLKETKDEWYFIIKIMKKNSL